MREAYDFIFSRLPRVRGYIDVLDALIFSIISAQQKENAYGGGVVEIGIFYGRSFFLLRHLNHDEKCLAIDLFDIGRTKGLLQQYDQFIQYGKDMDLPVDEDLTIAGDSTKLSADDILGKVGTVKFFSIDGGHRLEHVEADAALAKATLADHGVIVFDDSFSPEWPEVTVGIVDFMRRNDDFRVFCITDKKLYACRERYAPIYKKAILEAGGLQRFPRAEKSFLASLPVQIRHPVKQRICYELMQASGTGGLSRYIYGL